MDYCNGCKQLSLSTSAKPLTGNKKCLRAKCQKYSEELQAVAMEDAKINLENLPALEATPGVIVFPLPKCEGRE